jgi:CheY-like chemotaxis protein
MGIRSVRPEGTADSRSECSLCRGGHTISLAYDGDQALRLGRTAAFDLVLLDVMLPRMDGYTVIRKLRENRDLDLTPLDPLVWRSLSRRLGFVRNEYVAQLEKYLQK